MFLSLDPDTLNAIFTKRGGQARVNELFRRVQGKVIRRAELATVAQQDDFMKRARLNGGARASLLPEGIVILGHMQRDMAAGLDLPVPRKGELVSARIVPCPWRQPRVVDL